jgi:hypothetical protein
VHLFAQLDPPPDYLKTRIELFDKLKAEYDAMVAGTHEAKYIPPLTTYR